MATCSRRREPAAPRRPEHLGAQIKRTIARETGIVLNPHAFRHLSAKLFLAAHPGEYETVRLFLGHKSLNTTVRAYCGLEQADALRRLDALIDRHRNNPGTDMTRRPPIADWPERDRALWEKGVEPKGLFEGGGVGAGWSDASRFKTARGYRHWLLWLTAQGILRSQLERRGSCDPRARRGLRRRAETDSRALYRALPRPGTL